MHARAISFRCLRSLRVLSAAMLVAGGTLASLHADGPASVRGTVLDPAGRPIAGATVLVEGALRVVATTSTDHSGAFSIHLEPGRYALRTSYPGLAAPPLDVVLVEGTESVVTVSTQLSARTEAVVVSATLVEGSLSATAAPLTLFDARDVEARQITTAAQLLRLTQGTTVSQSGSAGALTSLFPRGGESNFSLVLVDGVRVNDMGGGFDFALLPTVGLDRVEIVRGPQSALFGADAIGGVVQVVTKAGGPTHADGLAEWGSQASTRLSAGGAGSIGRWSWGGGLDHRRSDGFSGTRTRTGDVVSNDDGRQTTASARTRLNAESWRVGGHVRWLEFDRGYPGPFGSDPNGTYSGIDSISRGRNTHVSVGGLAEMTVSPRIRAQGTVSFADLSGEFASPFGPPSSNDTLRWNTRGLVDIALSRQASLSAGAEVLDERGTSSFITGRTPAPLPIERRNVGTFAEGRVELTARLALAGGVRVEHIRRDALDGDGFRPPFDRLSVLSVNPRASINWLLRPATSGTWSWTRVRANAGTGIRAPDIFEVAFTDNPALEPERSKSYDVGVEQALVNGRLLVEGTWFDNRYDDLIVAVGPAFRGSSRYRTDNIANARARGLELSASSRPLAAVSVRAGYTWLDSAILAVDGTPGVTPSPFVVDDPLIRRPRHQAWLDVVMSTGRASAFARMGARGRVLDIDPSFGAFGGRLQAPGFVTTDLGASVNVVGGLAGFARITNVFNRRYEEALGFPSPNRQVVVGFRIATRR